VSTHIILAAALLAPACSNPPPPEREAPPVAVRVAPVRTGPIQESVEYVGTVRSSREVRVLARVAGTVADLPVEEGGAVSKGTVVARITAPENDARVHQVAAEARRAKTEREYLCNRFDIDKSLADTGAMSSAQLDASKRACESSRAGETAALAARAQVVSIASKATESASLDGVVLQRLVEPGEHVLPGMPLLVVGGEQLEVRVPVAELDVQRGLKENTPVLLRPGVGDPIKSSVAAVAPLATGPGRTIEVRITIPPEKHGGFSHGQSVDVSFIAAEQEIATAVPLDAVVHEAEGPTVFVVEEDIARRKRVSLGLRDRSWIEVSPDLGKDALVAISGQSQLKDGLRVYAVPARGVSR